MPVRTVHARPWAAGILLVAIASLLTACSVSRSMQVRTGVDPRSQDEDVRFRTTYYFRVFDICEGIAERPDGPGRNDTVLGGKARGPYQIRTDSLYRFRMTGKAYSLFQKIHFESGTLRKEQIDPFGANVVYDGRTNRFVHKSREETQEDARRESRFVEVARLRALRDSFGQEDRAARAEVDRVIEEQIRAMGVAQATQHVATAGMLSAAQTWEALGARLALLESGAAAVLASIREADARLDAAVKALPAEAATLNAAKQDLEAARQAVATVADARARRSKAVEDALLAARAALQQARAASDALRSATSTPEDKQTAAREYGAKAADYAAMATAAAGAHKSARDGLSTALTAAEKALAPVQQLTRDPKRGGGPEGPAAGKALEDATGRIRQHRNEWSGHAERSASTAALATDISSLSMVDAGRGTQPYTAGAVSCADGNQARRGFQILGPEGWRTFDQGDRLIMAMSSSAKPLIGTLQEISRDLANAQQSPAEALLPLVTERLRINAAIETLKRYEEAGGADVGAAIREILRSFEAPTGAEARR